MVTTNPSIEKKCGKYRDSYLERASCCSLLTIGWAYELINKVYVFTKEGTRLKVEDVDPLPKKYQIKKLVDDWDEAHASCLAEDFENYGNIRNHQKQKPAVTKLNGGVTLTTKEPFQSSHETSDDNDTKSFSQPPFPGIFKIMWRARLHIPIILSITGFVCATMTRVAQVFIFKNLVIYLERGVFDYKAGLPLILGMWILSLIDAIGNNHASLQMYNIAVMLRQLIMAELYKKSLKISMSSRQGATVGQIVDLMSNDCYLVYDAFRIIYFVPWSLIQIAMWSILLVWLLGVIGLVAVGSFAVIPLLSHFIKSMIIKYKRQQLKRTDERIMLMTEILQGILLVKMYVWEDPFAKRLESIRSTELNLVKKILVYKMVGVNLPRIMPWICIFITTVCYLKIEHQEIDLAKVFMSISIINWMRLPFIFMNVGWRAVGEMQVAVKRLNEFFNLPEVPSSFICQGNASIPKGRLILKGNFYRDPGSPAHCLTNMNIDVEPGELLAIVGRVGSGKSTCFHAILGELFAHENSWVQASGQVGYMAQSAWIRNATVRSNILMNLHYDKAKYDETVRNCALIPDLKSFQNYDLTEVGERGITLSGGQRARICLARLLYRAELTDIFLLDEPLAAVDVHVSSVLWHTIKDKLKNKTRLVIINSHFDLLPYFDRIIVFETKYLKCGHPTSVVKAIGTFEELRHLGYELGWFGKTQARDKDISNNSREIIAGGLSQVKTKLPLHAGEPSSPTIDVNPKDAAEEDEPLLTNNNLKPVSNQLTTLQVDEKISGLVQIEDQETGKVGWGVWKLYFDCAAGGSGWVLLIFTVISFLTACIVPLLMKVMFAKWMSYEQRKVDSLEMESSTDWWISNFTVYLCVALLALLGNSYVVSLVNMWASFGLHDKALRRILRAPIVRFFQITPVGRILNRFTGDLDQVDNLLPIVMQESISILLMSVSTIILIAYNTPWFLLMALPVCGLYALVFNYFRQCSRQMKRLILITKSPIFSIFEESLIGLITIRSLDIKKHFTDLMYDMLDKHGKIKYMHDVNSKWLAIRVDCLAAGIVGLCGVISIFFVEHIDPSLMSLTIVLAMQLGGEAQWGLRCWIDCETQMCAVERLSHYTKSIPVESDEGEQLPKGWLKQGELKFENIKLRYREGLPLVLKGLSFHIPPHSKVGVIGRTGAGKSTIMLLLYRIIDPSEGKLVIDGYDSSKIHLKSLRREISMIPQEPVMFSGTLRWNLDPFEEYTDEEIWQVLRDIQMEKHVRAVGDLNIMVAERGENFSCGQRQLFCIGRALLRSSGLILLDEATAYVDTATDRTIQIVINRLFKDRTMLVIAHRLETVSDSDFIVSLEDGVVKEFGSAEILLTKSNSILTQSTTQVC